MNRIYIGILAVMILACEDEKTEVISNTLYISGSASYTNPLTGIIVDRPTNVFFTIRRENKLPLPTEFKDSIEGFEFTFGPLTDEKYIIRAEWEDVANKIKYEAEHEFTNGDDNKINLQLNPDANSRIAKVSVSYTDIFSNQTISNQASISGTLRKTDGQFFPSGPTLSATGSVFVFSQLSVAVSYTLEAIYIDPLIGATYKEIQNFTLTETDELKSVPSTLVWLKTPTALVTLLDQSGAPVEGAEIYTYTNPAFLNQFKDNAEASVREGVTNSKGQVVFTNLEEIKYYFYGVKKIGTTVFRTADIVPVDTPLPKDVRTYTITLQ